MRHWIFIALAGVMISCISLLDATSLPAQVVSNPPRLCFMTFDPIPSATTRFSAFFARLKELGYRDGKTIAIDYLSADGQGERFLGLAEECLRHRPDIIAVTTTPAAKAATATTKTVPVVMLAFAVDPTETGLVASLAHPGGNLTGQSQFAPGLSAKRLQLLAELVPNLSRVLVLAYPADPITAPQIRDLQRAATELNLTLHIGNVRSAEDLPSTVANAVKDHAQAMLTLSASIFQVNRARIIDLAARHRLPSSYPFLIEAREGGLMAYSPNFGDMYRRAAEQVDRILKGAKAADLPVEQPTKFELVVNLKTAKALGLSVPQSLLQRADEVIE